MLMPWRALSSSRFLFSLDKGGLIGRSFVLSLVAASVVSANVTSSRAADPEPLPELVRPPQDRGLPYTRSAHSSAMAKIGKTVAVFAGSRYAYVLGYRVRLDPGNLLGGEALLRDGEVLVPAAFAGALDLSTPSPKPAPAYLADRWVYDLELPTRSDFPRVQVEGKDYVNFAELARARGWKVFSHPRGLVVAGKEDLRFGDEEQTLLDTVISQFDTPDKYADPDIATKHVPTLTRQGKWTDHVKVTPEQNALLNGPETAWETPPKSRYDLAGFNASLLGSKVPAPGVYPRVLFSPEDVPMLARRIKESRIGQMSLAEAEMLFKRTWWDPTSSDGRLFQELASDDYRSLKLDGKGGFEGHVPGIHSSHVNYIVECLTAMAFYSLLNNDDERGTLAARALANYYRLIEPAIDERYALSDSEFGSSYVRPDGTVVPMNGNGSTTHWRGINGPTAPMNLGLALDFAGKWMNAADREVMRRVIAKTTYGRRAYAQDGPPRFRDVNWLTWDLPQILALAAIEGLEGFDPEAFAANVQSVKAFCDWGIDGSGQIFESNGKTGPGTQFFILAMVTTARRGENFWGHPHFRDLLFAQVMMTSPTGRVNVNSGTQYSPFSNSFFSKQVITEIRAFYPENRYADYLLSRGSDIYTLPEPWDAGEYRRQVPTQSRLRLPSPTHPSNTRAVLYDSDYQRTTREDLKLPNDFVNPTSGVLSSFSDASSLATWINLSVRPNHYLGAGHHHADAGMFHFSALGVDWFTESNLAQVYDGKLHNQVLVDGISQPNGYQAAATWLGASTGEGGSYAGADLTNSYNFRWLTQPGPVWKDSESAQEWEMDPSSEIARIFAGTARYKLRPWWPNSNFSNYIATSRASFNPMEYVFRSAGIVRGSHPYAFVFDDVKKDGESRLYQWSAMLNGGVWQANVPGLAPNQFALAFLPPPQGKAFDASAPKSILTPKRGDPVLIVTALGMAKSDDPALPLFQVETVEHAPDSKGRPQRYDRFLINQKTTSATYRILLTAIRHGDPIPRIESDAAGVEVTVSAPGQVDTISFRNTGNARTGFRIARGDRVLVDGPR